MSAPDTKPGDHPGGSLNTTPPIGFTQVVPSPPPLDLESDEPLAGGVCDLDGTCESCQ